jgi:hypothetical protein
MDCHEKLYSNGYTLRGRLSFLVLSGTACANSNEKCKTPLVEIAELQTRI